MNLATGANSKQQTEQTFSIAIPIRLFRSQPAHRPKDIAHRKITYTSTIDILAEDEPADVIPYYSYTRYIHTEWTCFSAEQAHTSSNTRRNDWILSKNMNICVCIC